jgi:hypothetical protein
MLWLNEVGRSVSVFVFARRVNLILVPRACVDMMPVTSPPKVGRAPHVAGPPTCEEQKWHREL